MPATLSLVIAAKNCAERLETTILPWKPVAQEIIVVDQMSTDATPDVALKLGCKLIRNEPEGGNFDLNRKLGMERATSDWILYLDTDERPTSGLIAEVNELLKRPLDGSEPSGVRIPNLFYFLGKPLKHGIYSPKSAEIRLVRAGRWSYPTGPSFHIGVSVTGPVLRFKNPYKHFNVNSLSEWFLKTDQYTEHDAARLAAASPDGRGLRTYRAFWDAFRFFVRHYFLKGGFLDGFHGLVSVFYFMLYHLTLRVKTWEKVNERKLAEERDFLKPLGHSRR